MDHQVVSVEISAPSDARVEPHVAGTEEWVPPCTGSCVVGLTVGAGIALFGALIAAFGTSQGKKPEARVRFLPLDTPVRFVPPPGGGGTTIVVPAIGGTW